MEEVKDVQMPLTMNAAGLTGGALRTLLKKGDAIAERVPELRDFWQESKQMESFTVINFAVQYMSRVAGSCGDAEELQL